MKAKLGMRLELLLGCMMITGQVLAQSPDILAFHGNGNMTWTNNNSNLFYQVQWTASLASTSVWQSTYSTLSDIQSTSPTVTIPVPMFYRVAGLSNRAFFAALVPKTGQTNSYATRDDGALTKGVALPNPRFTPVAVSGEETNQIRDNLTGLIWARNANQFGMVIWATALTDCNNLTYGGTNDWRLPNLNELKSLPNYSCYHPAICNTEGNGQWTENDPFTGVQSDVYWASTTDADLVDRAWYVGMYGGHVYLDYKTTPYYVWPVRGGQ